MPTPKAKLPPAQKQKNDLLIFILFVHLVQFIFGLGKI